MNGPIPTTKVFLSELPSLPLHSKVRFLGCVRKYDVSTGRLILEHNYPPAPARTEPGAVPVDINVLLESIEAEDLRVGAWINVLGYVRKENRTVDANSSSFHSIYIEAVMIFAAGAIRIGEYERILRDSQEVERRVRRPGQSSSGSVRS